MMDVLVQKLHLKLRQWKPETVDDVRTRLGEIIEMADLDTLDLARSRALEQEVLDLVDHKPVSRQCKIEQ
jgi:exonuclease V gamma subunit